MLNKSGPMSDYYRVHCPESWAMIETTGRKRINKEWEPRLSKTLALILCFDIIDEPEWQNRLWNNRCSSNVHLVEVPRIERRLMAALWFSVYGLVLFVSYYLYYIFSRILFKLFLFLRSKFLTLNNFKFSAICGQLFSRRITYTTINARLLEGA